MPIIKKKSNLFYLLKQITIVINHMKIQFEKKQFAVLLSVSQEVTSKLKFSFYVNEGTVSGHLNLKILLKGTLRNEVLIFHEEINKVLRQYFQSFLTQ